MRKMKFKVIWHEPSNIMAVVDPLCGGLPLLHVCDSEYDGINPFMSSPLSFLGYYGWVEIGEL